MRVLFNITITNLSHFTATCILYLFTLEKSTQEQYAILSCFVIRYA